MNAPVASDARRRAERRLGASPRGPSLSRPGRLQGSDAVVVETAVVEAAVIGPAIVVTGVLHAGIAVIGHVPGILVDARIALVAVIVVDDGFLDDRLLT